MHQNRLPRLLGMALTALALCTPASYGAGLGPIRVESKLGQPLRASITLAEVEDEQIGQSCIKAKIRTVDGTLIGTPRVRLNRSKQTNSDQPSTIVLSLHTPVEEPVAVVVLDVGCGAALHREYQIVLDLDSRRSQVPVAPFGSDAAAGTEIDMLVDPSELKRDDYYPTVPVKPAPAVTAAAPKIQKPPSVTASKQAPEQSKESLIEDPIVSPKMIHSSNDELSMPRLKLSFNLSPAGLETDALKRDKFKQEQEQFAALMQDEDPAQLGQAKLKVAQETIKTAMVEAQDLKEKSRRLDTEISKGDQFSVQFEWMPVLGGFLLFSLMVFGGLFWRYRSMQKSAPNSWDNTFTDSGSLHSSTGEYADSGLQHNSLEPDTHPQTKPKFAKVENSIFMLPVADRINTQELDPVLEAEVYISYGRDEHAEEILKDALENHPDFQQVILKLLEIYAKRKDVDSFELYANQLYDLTDGVGEIWKQAATLGVVLDRKNTLYTSGDVENEAEKKI